jgi:hypothetical protein
MTKKSLISSTYETPEVSSPKNLGHFRGLFQV